MTRSTTSIEDAVDRFYDEDGAAVELVPLRRGHWMTTASEPHRLFCSMCLHICLIDAKVSQDSVVPKNYCPNCGAKMDKEADE